MNNLIARTLFFVILVSGMSLLNLSLFRKNFPGKAGVVLLFPGIVIHEISHLFGCLITGAKVKEIKLFSLKGGYVKHRKPKVPIIGKPIISFFPLFIGLILIHFSVAFLHLDLPYPDFSFAFFRDLFYELRPNFSNYEFWGFLYLIGSIIMCMIPSKRDLKNAIFGLFFTIFFLLILSRTNLFFNKSALREVESFLALIVSISTVILIFNFLIYFLKLSIRKII